jgi:hypothetical protein
MQDSVTATANNGVENLDNESGVIDTTSFFTLPDLQKLMRRESLGFFRLTTAGLNATWYSPPQLWANLDSYPMSKNCFSTPDFELKQIIGNLVERSRQLDLTLYKDFGGASGFSFTKSAFRDLGSSLNSDVRWQKDFFTPLLLDRLLWLEHCTNHPSDHLLPFQTPHDPYCVQLKHSTDLADLEKKWHSVIRDFAESWKNHSFIFSTSHDSDPLRSLFEGVERADNNIHVAKVFRNFCTVALAIRSLLIVSIDFIHFIVIIILIL